MKTEWCSAVRFFKGHWGGLGEPKSQLWRIPIPNSKKTSSHGCSKPHVNQSLQFRGMCVWIHPQVFYQFLVFEQYIWNSDQDEWVDLTFSAYPKTYNYLKHIKEPHHEANPTYSVHRLWKQSRTSAQLILDARNYSDFFRKWIRRSVKLQ